MEDYPRKLTEFEARFANDEACRDYLFRLRWPEGFGCPHCGRGKAWPVRRVLFECAHCGAQVSVTAGTIFQDTRLPLTLWFRAMWWVTAQKNGGSALGLQRILGLGSYKTAWGWLHKLRRAMVRPGRDRLRGWVEVDETYVGGLEEGVSGRQTEKKALVAVACNKMDPVWVASGCGGSLTPQRLACTRFWKSPSNPAVSCTPMDGKDIRVWKPKVIGTR